MPVEQLSIAIMERLRSHYQRRPKVPETVIEALNALAICAAATIDSTKEPVLRDLFVDALDRNLREFGE